MSELAEFLRTRYAEQRAVAEVASPWPWKVNPDDSEEVLASDILVADVFALSSNQTRNTAAFIAANDPGAVIADLDAKIALLNEHEPGGRYWPDSPRQYCKTCGSGEPDEYPTDWPCRTLRILARPFAGHPDYKGEEWAP